MRKGHVEETLESRIEVLQRQKTEHEQAIAKINFALDQFGVYRDEVFEGEADESDES
jgi:prefoldin subunit 5